VHLERILLFRHSQNFRRIIIYDALHSIVVKLVAYDICVALEFWIVYYTIMFNVLTGSSRLIFPRVCRHIYNGTRCRPATGRKRQKQIEICLVISVYFGAFITSTQYVILQQTVSINTVLLIQHL